MEHVEYRPPMENDSNAATAEELEQWNVDVYVERALHGPVFRMAYEHTHTYCEFSICAAAPAPTPSTKGSGI